MSIILQQRDLRILKLAYEHQFVLVEHAEKYFSDGGYRAACRRLHKLYEAGFLCLDPNDLLGRKPVYRVTPLGAGVLLQNGGAPVRQSRRLNPNTVVHDSIVISVRQRLEDLWNATFVCERAIKRKEYREVPDGVFFFPSGRGIALEVENSQKEGDRFVKLLKRWSHVPQIGFVLYLATRPELLSFVQRQLTKGPEDRPMGVVLWSELAAGLPTVWTVRGETQIFDRREF